MNDSNVLKVVSILSTTNDRFSPLTDIGNMVFRRCVGLVRKWEVFSYRYTPAGAVFFCCLFRFETAAGIRNLAKLVRATSRHFSHSDILAGRFLHIIRTGFTLFGSLTQRQD